MKVDMDMLKNLTVLIAEDDKTTRETISRMLSVFFEKVLVVDDGVKALEAYDKHSPNIVILDIRMPSMNGLELASIIRKKDIYTPIIIATSYTENQDLLKAVSLNLASYIIKPFGFDELKVALLESLQRLDIIGMLNKKLSGSLSYDFTTKTLYQHMQILKLTKNETILFELLLRRQGSLVSYDEIEYILGGEMFKSKASIKNTVLRLRKKIDENLIVNVQDLGYMLA